VQEGGKRARERERFAGAICFKDEPREAESLETGKGEETDVPLEPPERKTTLLTPEFQFRYSLQTPVL
jgi:hypothetical protein